MITGFQRILIWAAWGALFGLLYLRAFLGGDALAPAQDAPAPAMPVEVLPLDPPDEPVELRTPPEPVEQAKVEPPKRDDLSEEEKRSELDLPVVRVATPADPQPTPVPVAPDAQAPPPSLPETASASPEEITSALPESVEPMPAAPASEESEGTIPPLDASEGHQPFVETYLMLPGLSGLATLERDFDLVLLAFDGEHCFRLRREGATPRFEPIVLNDLLRTHHGQRYLVPSLDLAGQPTPYRSVLEAFARFRGAPNDRLQLQVALPAGRTQSIERARGEAREALRAKDRWWGVLLVHFEAQELRFEVQ